MSTGTSPQLLDEVVDGFNRRAWNPSQFVRADEVVSLEVDYTGHSSTSDVSYGENIEHVTPTNLDVVLTLTGGRRVALEDREIEMILTHVFTRALGLADRNAQ